MPKRVPYLLRWCAEHHTYRVETGEGALTPPIDLDRPAWFAWLDTVAAFSFQSASGECWTVRQEPGQRGGTYWYAYRRTPGGRIKRYLGRTSDLTLERLVAATAAPRESAAGAIPAERVPQRSGDTSRWGTPGSKTGQEQASAQPSAASRESNSATSLLLTTKWQVPRTSLRHLARPHVSARLQAGLSAPLTLLSAPAGFGKTMALSAWAATLPHPVGWVSLDAGENDPVQFWTYVLTALEHVYPGLAGTPLALLSSPQPPPLPAVLRTLLNAMAARREEVVLVLDDYHLITNPAIHTSLRLLLEHPPVQWHLYLATRVEPPLPLARLRASGQVNELRAEDLRFRPAEVAAFLGEVMGVPLSADEYGRLAERTDGWVAGLQLAGLSLQDHPDPSRFVATFGGTHRQIMRYLGEEILTAQPDEVQSFLLATSLVERLCGSLCDALTGRQNGQAMLEHLERANLFLEALDDVGQWYRYHHLFAEMLRQRLRQEHPEQVAALHQRAARWFERAGWITEAVDHLWAIPNVAEATRLIEQLAIEVSRQMQGNVALLLRLLERLPEAVIAARPRLCLAEADALITWGQLETAEERLTWAARALGPGTEYAEPDIPPSERRILTGELAALKAYLALTLRSDVPTTLALVQEAFAALPEQALMGIGAYLTLGDAHQFQRALQAANTAYTEAYRLSLLWGSHSRAMIALNCQAAVLKQQGHLQQALQLYQQVIQVVEGQESAAHPMIGTAYAGLGSCLYEGNNLAGARQAFERGLAFSQQREHVGDQVEGLFWLALVAQAQGQPEAAQAAIQQAELLLHKSKTFPWIQSRLVATAAHLALRQGHLADAERWAEGRALAVEETRRQPFQDVEELVFARLLLAQGKLEAAAQLVERRLQAPETEQQTEYMIELLALQALIWQARGDVTAA